jgi:hypothetical protein
MEHAEALPPMDLQTLEDRARKLTGSYVILTTTRGFKVEGICFRLNGFTTGKWLWKQFHPQSVELTSGETFQVGEIHDLQLLSRGR